MTPSNSHISTSIQQAIISVWADAGYDSPGMGIVPLFDLMASYPIWFAEVEQLTLARAIHFLAERTGQTPDLELENDGPLSGFFYAFQFRQSFGGCILVEKGDRFVRRRFSVAHELGHYKLHFEPLLVDLLKTQSEEGLLMTDAMIYADKAETTIGTPPADGEILPVRINVITQQPSVLMSDEKEIEANQFAANLLMPDDVLRERVNALCLPVGQPRGYLAARLASEFLVSKEAMAYRLAALGL
jgi:Zn-dependent peptidase ImmA (M78 family)